MRSILQLHLLFILKMESALTRSFFLYIADLVGKEDEAQAYVDDFNTRVMDAKEEIQEL